MGATEKRMEQLGIQLQQTDWRGKGAVEAVFAGDILYLSSHFPVDDMGRPVYVGRVGAQIDEETAYKAARLCGLNMLRTIQSYIGSLDRVEYFVKALCLVNSAGDFYNMPPVMNGFSDLMVEVFGHRGQHARAAMGAYVLEGNMPVCVDAIIKVRRYEAEGMSTIHTIREDGQETVQRFPKYKPLIPIREVDGVVYVSGHGPENINTYEPLYRGRVGADLTLEEGYAAAAECAKTLLRAVQERYGSLDCIHHMVRALALVNCGEDFTEPEKVADGFSDTCMQILQERGQHARTVMGTRNMPNYNIPVEVEMIFVLVDVYRNKGERNKDGTI